MSPEPNGPPSEDRTPDRARPRPESDDEVVARPLAVSGIVAAVWCAGLGLTTLTTVTLIGWIAAPRTALGTGLPGVFRTAVNFWLVSHHAGFSVPHGRVGLLPLGLIVLPGALLFRGGGWITRTGRVRGRYRIGVVHAALALAVPYAVLAFLLALIARSTVVSPSPWQALLACFLLALIAGGLGAARTLVASTTKGSPWVAMLMILPHRARSVAAGVTGATAVLIGSGLLIFLVSLLFHISDMTNIYGVLSPGVVGGILLSIVALAYLPNAAIWAVSYAVGPGFAVGAGTSVAPSGVFVGMIPSFPPFAALPAPGPAPLVSLLALVVPFAAGVAGGVLTIRALPSAVSEAAPLWGFVCGVLTGGVVAFLAALSGGPVGGARMAVMGPSAWQTGLMAVLEVGVSAAIAAWAANWRLLRRMPQEELEADAEAAPDEERTRVPGRVEFDEDPEPVLATVDLQAPLPDGVTPIGERQQLPGVPRPRKDADSGSVTPLRKRPPRDRPR
ncbi:DUF6350 family protein [Actinomadura sp. DC4]|uniref:cell division protein PerM n=1 Tax=Actinomadura sp. DC4 TaxID=3055069 RepID=UPI0025B0FC66|nr:DUF6350 family protein [Actinomadura sp. DC4]MDN3357129.1 DUF6350 family protein [Actinomadura sp. DC4]